MNTKEQQAKDERTKITNRLCQGATRWRKLVTTGLNDSLLEMFAFKKDQATGYIVPSPEVSRYWLDLLPLIRSAGENVDICAAWDRILSAIADDPIAQREVTRAKKRRERDDMKPVVIQGVNYGLRQYSIGTAVEKLGICEETATRTKTLRQILSCMPDILIGKIEEFTCELRSVIVNVGPKIRRRTKKLPDGTPYQPTLGMTERRYALVPGPALLALLGIEGVVSSGEYAKLEKMIFAYNSPRWKTIKGIKYGNLKQADASNPVVKLLSDRQAQLIRQRTIAGSRNRLMLPKRIAKPTKNKHFPV